VLNPKIKDYLARYTSMESESESHSPEISISIEIRNIVNGEGTKYIPSPEDQMEMFAFDFLADTWNADSKWDTYYGPFSSFKDRDGNPLDSPSIDDISKESIEYWSSRSRTVIDPLLRARYADISVDFYHKVYEKRAPRNLVQLSIDSQVQVVKDRLVHPLDCKSKLRRALNLSITIQDKARTQTVAEAIIKLEDRVADDTKPGLWGFSIRWLLIEHNSKITLPKNLISKILFNMESRLERLVNNSSILPVVDAPLSEYYSSINDENNVKRVLMVLENSLKTSERIKEEPLLTVHLYELIQETYKKYSTKYSFAAASLQRITTEIGALNLPWNESFHQITVESAIPNEEIEAIKNNIFGCITDQPIQSLDEVLARIAINFLPKKSSIQQCFEVTLSQSPLRYLFSTKVISGEGLVIGSLGSVENDFEGHFAKYASEHISYDSILLNLVIEGLKTHFTATNLVEKLFNSELFRNENKQYLERAIEAYWSSDYIVASHLFIPMIETALRELVRVNGGTWIYSNSIGGFNTHPLNQLFKKNEGIFDAVFGKIPHNVLFYLRLVLIDQLGMNLRNDFAHGFSKDKFFSPNVSDRLFHVILILGLVSEEKQLGQ